MNWFCWVCREPLEVVHRVCAESTRYRINGKWQDCHEECYKEYQAGMPTMRNALEELRSYRCVAWRG